MNSNELNTKTSLSGAFQVMYSMLRHHWCTDDCYGLSEEQKDNLAWAQREILTAPVGIVMEVQLNTGS